LDKSPGWFGLLAWVLAQAHASLGPEEPHLNGGGSFGGGVPWVDDYAFLTPLLEQRAKVAYEAYVDLATAAAGKTAVNLEKGALDGVPRIVFSPWGSIMDLTRVTAEGPAAGMLSATPDKIHKFLTQLTAPEFSFIHDRKLPLKALGETTGLAVWLAQTNSLLKMLLPFFYNSMNSRDSDYVKPAGNAQSVNLVWAGLKDAVALVTQMCRDSRTFRAVFTAAVTRALSPLEQVTPGIRRTFLQSDSTGKDVLLGEDKRPVLGPNGKPMFTKAVFAVACFALGVWGADLLEGYERPFEKNPAHFEEAFSKSTLGNQR